MNSTTAPLALGDRADLRLVNNFARGTDWLRRPVVAYAAYGVVLLVAGFLLARSRRDPLLLARALLARAGVLLAGVLVLVHRSADASFPSDLATMAGAAAAGLLLVDRRVGVAAAVAVAGLIRRLEATPVRPVLTAR